MANTLPKGKESVEKIDLNEASSSRTSPISSKLANLSALEFVTQKFWPESYTNAVEKNCDDGFYVIYGGEHAGIYSDWGTVEKILNEASFSRTSPISSKLANLSTLEFVAQKSWPESYKNAVEKNCDDGFYGGEHAGIYSDWGTVNGRMSGTKVTCKKFTTKEQARKSVQNYDKEVCTQLVLFRRPVARKEEKKEFTINRTPTGIKDLEGITFEEFRILWTKARTADQEDFLEEKFFTDDKITRSLFNFVEGANPDLVHAAFKAGLIRNIYPSANLQELKNFPKEIIKSIKNFRTKVLKDSDQRMMYVSITSSIADWEQSTKFSPYYFIEIGLLASRKKELFFPASKIMNDEIPTVEDLVKLRVARLKLVVKKVLSIHKESKVKVNYRNNNCIIISWTPSAISKADMQNIITFEYIFRHAALKVAPTTMTSFQKEAAQPHKNYNCNICQIDDTLVSQASSISSDITGRFNDEPSNSHCGAEKTQASVCFDDTAVNKLISDDVPSCSECDYTDNSSNEIVICLLPKAVTEPESCTEPPDKASTSSKTPNAVERRIQDYCSSQKILLVGEGDFSFSACLAKAFGSATNMVATSLDSKAYLRRHYRNAMDNISQLRMRGCKVFHGVDATNMENDWRIEGLLFDRIIYNFPHCGDFSNTEDALWGNQLLIKQFMENAVKMIEEDGEIHIRHKSNWYFLRWNLRGLASLAGGLVLTEEAPFDPCEFSGYNTKYGFEGWSNSVASDNNFNCHPSCTYKFVLSKRQKKLSDNMLKYA